MREIKFRGKRLDNGEWVEGHYSDFNHNPDGLAKMSYYIGVPIGGYEYKVAPHTIGQYTGLKDKNGKEIFEGDILKEDDRLYVVGWNHELASFTLNSQNGGWEYYFQDDAKNKYASVIGNIHDNPELLKPE